MAGTNVSRMLLVLSVAGWFSTPAWAKPQKNKKNADDTSETVNQNTPARPIPASPGRKPRGGQVDGPVTLGRPANTGTGRPARPSAQVSPRPRAQGHVPTQAAPDKPKPRSPAKPVAKPHAPRPTAQGPHAPNKNPVGTPRDKPFTQSVRPQTTSAAGSPRNEANIAGRPPIRIEVPARLPEGWAPIAHQHHLAQLPGYSPKVWGAGILSYNAPRQGENVVYVERDPKTGKPTRVDAPVRAVNRAGSIAVGLKGGTMFGTEDVATLTGDTGFGLMVRYRPVEAIGLEGTWMRHEDSIDGTLVRDPLSLSAQVFLFPWTRVSPFVSAGMTLDGPVGSSESVPSEHRFAPHGGLGVELAIGKSLAIDLEGRYLAERQSLVNDPAQGGAIQATAGVVLHF